MVEGSLAAPKKKKKKKKKKRRKDRREKHYSFNFFAQNSRLSTLDFRRTRE